MEIRHISQLARMKPNATEMASPMTGTTHRTPPTQAPLRSIQCCGQLQTDHDSLGAEREYAGSQKSSQKHAPIAVLYQKVNHCVHTFRKDKAANINRNSTNTARVNRLPVRAK